MTILQEQEKRLFFLVILRLVGYGLLLMAVVNVCWLLIPAQLMNPLWEFQTIGAIVEKVPVGLLGIALVYYGEKSDRTSNEIIILKVLSWGSLLAAILMMLIIPLNISNGFKIYHQRDTTANAQFVSFQDTIEQFKEQLELANSKAEIGAILQQQTKQKINIPNSVNTEKLKIDIITKLKNNQYNVINQAEAFQAQKHSLILKKCLKWNFGALISCILFLMIWKGTA